MRTSDVFRTAVHNLWQRRLRTLFNLTGIVTGCIVLLMTAAGTSGVRDAIHALFDSSDFAREIYIYPGGRSEQEPPAGEIRVEAEMSNARRERIRKALVARWNEERNSEDGRHELTLQDLDSIRRIPHVQAVIPEVNTGCLIRTADDDDPLATATAAWKIDSGTLKASLLTGALPDRNDRDGVLVDEFLAWQMGFRDDADLPKLVGQPLTIEYRVTKNRVARIYNLLTEQWNQLTTEDLRKQTDFLRTLLQLIGELDKTSLSDEQKQQLRDLLGSGLQPEAEQSEVVVTRQFTVRGIVYAGSESPVASLFRQWFHGVRAGLQLHPDVSSEIYLASMNTALFYNATVVVDRSVHLREVTEQLQQRQFAAQSSLAILENIDYQIDRSGWIVYGIAAAILLTAAIGISNTLAMSVVERTPEFGIMKSIGARDSQVLRLMVTEGAILGAVGGGSAIVASLVLGFCGQSLLKLYVESRTQTEIAGSLFQFSLPHALLILMISVALCTAATLLPAWRAARLDPVVAMRRT